MLSCFCYKEACLLYVFPIKGILRETNVWTQIMQSLDWSIVQNWQAEVTATRTSCVPTAVSQVCIENGTRKAVETLDFNV